MNNIQPAFFTHKFSPVSLMESSIIGKFIHSEIFLFLALNPQGRCKGQS